MVLHRIKVEITVRDDDYLEVKHRLKEISSRCVTCAIEDIN